MANNTCEMDITLRIIDPTQQPPWSAFLVSGSKPMAFDLWKVLSQSLFDILGSIKVSRGKCGNCTKVREQTWGDWLVGARQRKTNREAWWIPPVSQPGGTENISSHTRGLKQASSAYTQETDGRKKINKLWLVFNLPVSIPVLILQYIGAPRMITGSMNVNKHTMFPHLNNRILPILSIFNITLDRRLAKPLIILWWLLFGIVQGDEKCMPALLPRR